MRNREIRWMSLSVKMGLVVLQQLPQLRQSVVREFLLVKLLHQKVQPLSRLLLQLVEILLAFVALFQGLFEEDPSMQIFQDVRHGSKVRHLDRNHGKIVNFAAH